MSETHDSPAHLDEAQALDLLRRIISAAEVEECHHEGCPPFLSVGDGDGLDLTPDDVAVIRAIRSQVSSVRWRQVLPVETGNGASGRVVLDCTWPGRGV
ncbi:hypothetical protein PO878_04060 [Iamia majanohamensis]|uniref:Uncharacterized protein n=1 Tax=Iamia majanohamensis TaxID=467976 RepID=A0AAF0BUK0_9ACTN|nr:hypothetical protein [Iamia majanohamensis]WCO67897.1 hypothetical protein PO878_04060 [Iamia majanohamensis]